MFKMPKHNNALHNTHLRKHWQKWVRCNYNQPMDKLKRRRARIAKAKAAFPRPIQSLRPLVRGCTRRYNRKVRAGRGFTLEELKQAGLSRKFAQSIGISVDHRRTNLCVESAKLNVDRLKEYKAKLVLLPRKAGKPRSGTMYTMADATNETADNQTQGSTKSAFPVRQDTARQPGVKVTKDMQAFMAHRTVRQEWSNKKNAGKRAVRAREAEKE